MSIQFKLTTRNLNVKGMTMPYTYAYSVAKSEVSLEKVCNRIALISAMSPGDVKSLLDTLSTIIAEELTNGNIIDLGDLGRFRPSLKGKGELNLNDAKEFSTEKNIERGKVIFVPGASIRKAMTYAKFNRMVIGSAKSDSSNSS